VYALRRHCVSTWGIPVRMKESEIRLHDHRYEMRLQPVFCMVGNESAPHEAIMTRKALQNQKRQKDMDTQQSGFAGGHPPNYELIPRLFVYARSDGIANSQSGVAVCIVVCLHINHKLK